MRLYTILSIILLTVMCKTFARACDCMMHPLASYIPTSEYIIKVHVRKVLPSDIEYYYGINATAEVIESFKGGLLAGQLIEFDSQDKSNCSFKFEEGESYLIFAYRQGDKFCVYACSYSDNVTHSKTKKYVRTIKRYIRKHK